MMVMAAADILHQKSAEHFWTCSCLARRVVLGGRSCSTVVQLVEPQLSSRFFPFFLSVFIFSFFFFFHLVLLAEAKIAWRLGERFFSGQRRLYPVRPVPIGRWKARCIVHSLRRLDRILMWSLRWQRPNCQNTIFTPSGVLGLCRRTACFVEISGISQPRAKRKLLRNWKEAPRQEQRRPGHVTPPTPTKAARKFSAFLFSFLIKKASEPATTLALSS